MHLEDTVRRGTPATVRDDLFFFFMDGGWTRYLVSLAFLYLIGNVLFAALYILQPGCIDGGRAESFADAFFFSVETMSTIGYGAMSPATGYGHAIVTIEAAVGMLAVALATGLTFAKVFRPQARVLFSDAECFFTMIATLTGHDGTCAQTVHARHMYQPADVRANHHLVDIMSELPDGRMMIDYTRFHETGPDEKK